MKMETMSYGGWKNCIRLSNDQIELVATTDVGPRIIRLAFVGGPNCLKEWKDQLGKTGGDSWNIYGGHRLWHAPEVQPRTYAPDNSPIAHKWDGQTLRLTQPAESKTGIEKTMEITLDPRQDHVTVVHRLVNQNAWEIELAAWALTVMQGPGRGILPQEPARAHSEQLVPARAMALWGYTDMKDPRWIWGTRYLQLRSDPEKAASQKIGIRNTPGWAAYASNAQLFLKRFGFDSKAVYPDFGCNTECYTSGDMLEIESLGPLTRLAPQAALTHVEHWFIYKLDVGESEEAIDQKMLPLVRATDAFKP